MATTRCFCRPYFYYYHSTPPTNTAYYERMCFVRCQICRRLSLRLQRTGFMCFFHSLIHFWPGLRSVEEQAGHRSVTAYIACKLNLLLGPRPTCSRLVVTWTNRQAKDIQYSRQEKEGRRGLVQLVAPPCCVAVNLCRDSCEKFSIL